MREIKFRGKRIDNGEWVYGYYIFEQLTEEHNILVNVDNPYDNLNWHEVYKDTVGQFTGLQDKNQNEIYCGDMVEAWSQGIKAVGEVKQRIDGYWLMYPAWQDGKSWTLAPDKQGKTTVEIVGNIHDK